MDTASRKRLTREESKAQTRARLIAVGRKHFLRHGLGGSVAEQIAEDAGYSRGALYSHFDSKEDLFIAVIEEQEAHHFEAFRSILEDELSARERLKKFRDTFVGVVTDHEWIILHSEFEAEALRSSHIRDRFLKFHRKAIRDGSELINKLSISSEVGLKLRPDEFVMAMLTFSLGMGVNQKLFGKELSSRCARRLIELLFNELIAAP